jgi:DNA polymerase, archaea type
VKKQSCRYYRISYDREGIDPIPRYGIDLDRVYKLPMVKKNIFDGKYRTGKLEHVAPVVVNKGKYLGLDGLKIQSKPTSIQKAYVARDAQLTAELVRAMDAEIIGTMFFISDFMKLPLHKVCASTILTWWENKLEQFVGIMPKSKRNEKGEPEYGWRTEGGFIFLLEEDKHYRNVVSLDIASQYPWVIAVHGISPEVINCQCCKDDPAAQVPAEVLVDREGRPLGRQYWICKKRCGVLSQIIGEFRKLRLEAKSAGNKPKANALKVTCNGLYGLFRNSSFQWVDSRVTELTTCFARFYIKKIIALAESNYGFEAVYSHTDSLFFRSKSLITEEKVEQFKAEVESKMGLELDKPVYYDEFLIHKINNYIGFKHNDPEPEIVGFEGIKNHKPKIVQEAFTEFVYMLREEGKHNALTFLKEEAIERIKRKKGLDKNPEKWKVSVVLKKTPGNYKNKGDLKNRLGKHLGLQGNSKDIMSYYEIGKYHNDDSDIKEMEANEGLDAWLNPANVSVPKYLHILYGSFKPLLKILEVDINQVFGVSKESELFLKPKKASSSTHSSS